MRATTRRSARNGHDLTTNWLKIKNALSDSVVGVKGTAENIITDSVDDIKKTSAKAQNKVVAYTVKKPFKSLGIALLAGVVVGFLLRR